VVDESRPVAGRATDEESVGVDEEDVDNAARIRGNFFLEEKVRTRATGGGDSDGDDAQSKIEGGEDRLLKIEWRDDSLSKIRNDSILGLLKLRRHRHRASKMSSPGSDHSQSPVFWHQILFSDPPHPDR
jgi:hypothetical protein